VCVCVSHYVVSCHHGMTRPRVTDGGDGLQIWRVAANVSNKQSRTADMGSPPAWGLVEGLTNSHRKIHRVTKHYTDNFSTS